MKSLFERAKKRDITVLSDSNVSIVKDNDGWTPLHFLALAGKIEVLSHKDCSLVKDNDGETPLQWLAWWGKIEVLSHKDCSVVKNNYGGTPLHWLAREGKIEVSHLKKLFPWYKRKCKGKVTKEEITEILNTPNSIQYILEED